MGDQVKVNDPNEKKRNSRINSMGPTIMILWEGSETGAAFSPPTPVSQGARLYFLAFSALYLAQRALAAAAMAARPAADIFHFLTTGLPAFLPLIFAQRAL